MGLKTPDVRLFGWFKERGVFIIANINSAAFIKEKQLYQGYWNDTRDRRKRLDLDEPKFIDGGYGHVL